jgi:hypothetical protein
LNSITAVGQLVGHFDGEQIDHAPPMVHPVWVAPEVSHMSETEDACRHVQRHRGVGHHMRLAYSAIALIGGTRRRRRAV